MAETKTEGLALLRQPFPAHQISKLPKPTKAQSEEVKANFKAGIRCEICGSWHHPKVVHLDYVGHAALTDRLLDADPAWTWEPVADAKSLGLPVVDGGMWIRLTVCGVTRFGFGHVQQAKSSDASGGKSGGDAVKEIIGDALRNAAMRFGAALDLWHKGQLHEDEDEDEEPKPKPKHADKPAGFESWLDDMTAAADTGLDALRAAWQASKPEFRSAGADEVGKLKARAAKVTA